MSHFLKKQRKELVEMLHNLENHRSNLRKSERTLKINLSNMEIDQNSKQMFGEFFNHINSYVCTVENFGDFTENNFDFFMSEQL